MKGFVTIEGCEGVGKSTQVRFLKEYLERTSQAAVFTREPGGTQAGEKIREILLQKKMGAVCEAHLFAAARAEHIDKVILPAIKENKLVICDRYIDSSFAYQGFARGLGIEKVIQINSYAMQNCMPQYTVFLDMSPLNSWRRQKGKVIDDRMEKETVEFHLKVYNGFLELLKMYPQRFIRIVPHEDKLQTFERIKTALIERGFIN
ncbi:MAG: dTMP kinase [Bacillota bacterium]|jgi:dTMP kinase|nr:dTMP kinase [Bacillota bacterium]HHU44013.1 dTMP kinase [Clostridiales bacterium]